ncbi:MAG: hypothetical protein DWQ40_00370 [Actinobacteria bacterium]|nr:MAG: hypothetical protein DWQ40_00370 [Actinomycetota bacterium]REK35576.1 MAG: hypothetical protein DWQ20_06015 [Actinomycetota bacterium]
MRQEERRRIERELRDNGYLSVDDVPFSVKQLALLNFHKLDTLIDDLEERFLLRREAKAAAAVVGFLGAAIAVVMIFG